MGMTYNAHSAFEDVKALQSFVLHHKVSVDIMLKHSFGVEFVVSSIEIKTKTDSLISTITPLSLCVPDYMLKRLQSQDFHMIILDWPLIEVVWKGYRIFKGKNG